MYRNLGGGGYFSPTHTIDAHAVCETPSDLRERRDGRWSSALTCANIPKPVLKERQIAQIIKSRQGKTAGSAHLGFLPRAFGPPRARATARPDPGPDLDKIDRVVESPLIEDVFVWCTRFLRNVSYRLDTLAISPSPLTVFSLTHLDAARDAARIAQGLLPGLLLTSSRMRNGKEPKEARRPAPHNRYRDVAPT